MTHGIFLLIHLFVYLWGLIHYAVCNELCNANDICPPNRPFCSEVGCVFECPQPFYVNGTNCVENCGDMFVKGSNCLEQCPDQWRVRDTLKLIAGHQYLEHRCIQTCDMSEYLFENACLRACPLNYSRIDNNICRSHCPPDKHFLRKFSLNSVTYYNCVEECPNYANGDHCSDTCAKFVFNSTCIGKCPETYPLISDGICVKECPHHTVYIGNNKCARNCTKEKPFNKNRTCEEKCPDTFYITIRNGVIFCESKCQSGEYTYKDTCLSSCAYDGKRDHYLFYLNQTCREACPSNYFEQKDNNYEGKCVLSCPWDKFIHNRSCVQSCPENTFFFNSTCADKCPDKFPYICKIAKGQTCMAQGPSPNDIHKTTCVNYCPKDLLIFNNTCVKECPKSNLVYGQECVTECPKDCLYVQNKNHSFYKWTDCPYHSYCSWQTVILTEQIQECVSECSEGMYNFNFTCVSKCPQSYHYIDNGTCQRNSCTTKYMYNDSSNTHVICTDECKDNNVIYNRTCVKECPNTSRYIHLNVCTKACPKRKLRNEIKQGLVCIDRCPSGKYAFNNTCLLKCPVNTYIFNNSKCVFVCPTSYPLRITNGIWRCVESCKDDELYKNGKCIAEYDCTAPYFSYEKTCVKSCPKGYVWYKGCEKQWTEANVIMVAVTAGLFIFLSLWGFTTLKEYFLVLSMIIFETDVKCKRNSGESDTDDDDNQIEEEQPLLMEMDENEDDNQIHPIVLEME